MHRRGIFATCQAAAQNWSGMMALRFLLGLAETAYGPGAIYALSFFYRRHELGLRCGLFVSAAPLANTFAGALAYGITSGHSKLANWRLLFLVEGAPSLIAAVLAWFYLPDHPSTARFLTDEEKEVARARALRQSGEHVVVHNIDWKDVGRTLLDAKAWITAVRSDPFPWFLFLMIADGVTPVDVLQLQRELLVALRLSPHHPE
jgi:MFS family permease